jgi:hypothetical protein
MDQALQKANDLFCFILSNQNSGQGSVLVERRITQTRSLFSPVQHLFEATVDLLPANALQHDSTEQRRSDLAIDHTLNGLSDTW